VHDRRVLHALLDLLVPPCCLACGAPGGDLCGACRRTLPWLADPRHAGDAASFSEAWAPFAHEGPARALVAALKFRGATRAAHVMAAHLAQHRFEPGEVLIPVPTHPSRRRRRGFDHSVVLALALSRRTGVELSTCLRRGGTPERQLGSSRSRRLEAGRIVLSVRGRAPLSAVLVDDVETTGATLKAAARALKAAGTRNVRAVTYTRRLRS
jgi:predicted amidophosphoribosyltransferase